MAGKQVEIPFNEWSRERMRRGKKTATSRTKRYGEVGDWFEVDGQRYELIYVTRSCLDTIKKWYYRWEGCKTPEEFVEVWESIHRRAGFRPTQKIWFHVFKKVGE